MVQPEIFQPKSQTADQPPFVSTASRVRVFPMATGDLGSAPCSCVRSLCFLCGLVWRCVCSDEDQSWNTDRCHWRHFPAANGWFVPPKLSSRAKLSAKLRSWRGGPGCFLLENGSILRAFSRSTCDIFASSRLYTPGNDRGFCQLFRVVYRSSRARRIPLSFVTAGPPESGGGCRDCRLVGLHDPSCPTALVVLPSLTLFPLLSPFLPRLYSNPLTTPVLSTYHIPRIPLPSLLPGSKTPCPS